MYIVEEIAPLAEPLQLADVKNYLKVPATVTADDNFISECIQAAREEVEGFTGRSIVNKGYRQSLDSFPYFTDSTMSSNAYPPSYYSMPRYSTTLWNYSQMIKLLRAPLQAVNRITYSAAQTGTIQTLYPALFNWQALHEYAIGDQIEDGNNNMQTVTAVAESDEDGTSMSGPNTPTFSAVLNGSTTDGAITWTCNGPAPANGGDFVYDMDNVPARVFPMPGQTWPPVLYTPNAVQLHFTAGYGNDGKSAPAVLRKLMRYLISDAYYNREISFSGAIAQNPSFVRALWRYKLPLVAGTRG